MKQKLIALIQQIEKMKIPVSSNKEIGNYEKIQEEIRRIIKDENNY